MARPRKYIDKDEFEKLCGLQCTKQDICGWFDMTDKTLDAWVKRTYRSSFSEVFGQKRGGGERQGRKRGGDEGEGGGQGWEIMEPREHRTGLGSRLSAGSRRSAVPDGPQQPGYGDLEGRHG